MESTDSPKCPDCGATIEPAGPGCPSCLLELGISGPEPDPGPTHPNDDTDDQDRRFGYGTARTGPVAAPPGYVLGEILGEGGMGVVYRAEQIEPIRRTVALKMIRSQLEGAATVARFDRERQALARMDHPSIAQVFEAGSLEDGRPYIAMEYVDGTRITDFCDARRLTTRERLELFATLCDGVQHAHQKGIIHRDLKPSNVLITTLDERPTPKIIDFGIARAVDPESANDATLTELGAAIGTPHYMSPEQADLSPLGVDTRTDVYSLGVMLYEMITGLLPFDTTGMGLDDIRRAIREEEPYAPSSRVRTTPGSTAEFARRCGTDVRSLARRLAGDLDWITMKALAKQPDRRYATCAEFAADIRAHLADLPVQAGPPSAAYRMAKFGRRHRIGVAVAATALFATVGFAGVTTWQNQVIAEQRDAAESARASAERVSSFLADMIARVEPDVLGIALRNDLRDRIASARKARGEPTERVATAGSDLDAILAGVDMTGVARGILDRDILAGAGAAVASDLSDDPRVAARLEVTLGRTYRDLGLYEPAERHLERALGIYRRIAAPDDPDRVVALYETAWLFVHAGRYEDAGPYVSEVVDRAERTGASPAGRFGAEHHLLGEWQRARGDYTAALATHRELLEARRARWGPDHPDTLQALRAVAITHEDLGELGEAETLLREALERSRRLFRDDDPAVLGALSDLGVVLDAAGHDDEAEALLREFLERTERRQGRDHPDTLAAMNNLGSLLRQMGRPEGEALFREALVTKTRVLGPNHPSTLSSRHNYGGMLISRGRFEEAEAELRETWRRRIAVLGPDHRNTIGSQLRVGEALTRLGRVDDAEPILEDVVARYRGTLGDDNHETMIAIGRLAELRERQGRIADAEPLLLEMIDGLARTLGRSHDVTINAHNSLAWLHQTAGDPRRAEPHFRDVVRLREETRGPDHPWTGFALVALSRCLSDLERYDEAGELARRAVTVLRAARPAVDGASPPPLDWRTVEALVVRGRALIGAERFEEAERVLVEGADGFERLPERGRLDRRDEAFLAIIDLYERTGRPGEAAAWRARQASRSAASK